MSVGTAISEFRTLVVEDNEAFLQFVISTLRQQPNVQIVCEARDGIEAVERAEALQPDLILLDIGLPGLNGIEAAYLIRELAPDARILFLSQESAAEIIREAFKLGAWGYVIKAQAVKELPLAVEALLNGKKAFASEELYGPARGNSI